MPKDSPSEFEAEDAASGVPWPASHSAKIDSGVRAGMGGMIALRSPGTPPKPGSEEYG